jgi:hypothetical protein
MNFFSVNLHIYYHIKICKETENMLDTKNIIYCF